MTSYAGQAITYDAIGNPLTYRDGMKFTWKNGRELSTLQNSANTVSYNYNADGIRTQKTVNGVTTNYTLSGSSIIREQTGGNVTYYLYDDGSSPIGMIYNGVTYYYQKNLQGDVIRIVNSSGTQVVAYTYDAWGNIISTTGTLASTIGQINPIRYRSYYFDKESGLYYLNSRYYDSQVKRFVNGDDVGVNDDMATFNLFAYCGNNPTMRVDHGGEFWESIFDVVSLCASIVEVSINPTDPWAWAGLAGDTVDLIPFVTGVGEVTRSVKTTVKVVDKADDVVGTAKVVYKTADKASDIRKATGSYEIMFNSGRNYVGKGGFNRAIKSAQKHATKNTDEVVSIMWKSAPNKRSAFIDEYFSMRRLGVNNKNTYNQIWSPGRKYYYNEIDNLFK